MKKIKNNANIFINDNCKRGYNIPIIKFIQKELEVIKTKQNFSIIDDSKKILIKILEELIEENLKNSNWK